MGPSLSLSVRLRTHWNGFGILHPSLDDTIQFQTLSSVSGRQSLISDTFLRLSLGLYRPPSTDLHLTKPAIGNNDIPNTKELYCRKMVALFREVYFNLPLRILDKAIQVTWNH